MPVIEAQPTAPANRDPSYWVAVLQVQRQALLEQAENRALAQPEQSPARQLEGPSQNEAA